MAYIVNGYLDTNYYEGDEPLIPTDTILNTTYNITLNGSDITSNVISIDISESVGKIFETLTLILGNSTIPTEYIRNKDIRLIVTIGTDVHDFLIYDADRNYKGNYIIVGKTNGCLLDYPFSDDYSESFIGSSNDIISEFLGDIPNTIRTPDFNFNSGTFYLEGSKLDGVEKLVSVSGGQISSSNGYVRITERQTVYTDFPKFQFDDNILLSLDFSDNFDGSKRVDTVLFNTTDTDLTTEPKITMVQDEDCSKPYFLFNPTPRNINDISSNLGNSFLTLKTQIYEEVISGVEVIVSGGIERINYISIDGVPLPDTEYTFTYGYNGILFNSVVQGFVTVSYSTKAITMYSKNGDFNFFEKTNNYYLTYLNQELNVSLSSCVNTIYSDGLRTTSVDLVEEKIVLDGDTHYDVVGEVRNIALIADKTASPYLVNGYYAYGSFDTTFMNTISIENNVSVEKTFTSTLEDVTDLVSDTLTSNVFGFFTSKDITVSETLIGSISLTMTLDSSNVDYNIYYTDLVQYAGYTSTNVYTAIVNRYTIPKVGVSNTVKALDFYMSDSIFSFDYPDETDGTYSAVCQLPAIITLDVAQLLDIEPYKASGLTISYEGVSSTITSAGTTKINLLTQQRSIIDTSHIRKGSSITVDTTNAVI